MYITLQNSHAEDVAYVLQQAFTPNNVTAQPTSQLRSQATAVRAAARQRFGSGAGVLSRGGSGRRDRRRPSGGAYRRRLAGGARRRARAVRPPGPACRRPPPRRRFRPPRATAGRTARGQHDRGHHRDAAHHPRSAEQRAAGLWHRPARTAPSMRCCARSTSCRCRCASTR